MTIKLRAALLAAAAILAAAQAAYAHRAWILPSFTVVSGEGQWVGVDAAISNELFYPDHFPMQLANVKAVAPDGSETKLENSLTGKYRSTFDVALAQPGTYRIAQVNGLSRNETFISRDTPSAIKPVGTGIEMVPVGSSHPNKLVAGEPAKFAMRINGRPAAGLTITVLPGAARYRDNPGQLTYTTAADGSFTLNTPEPGYYWVNTRWTDPNAPAQPARAGGEGAAPPAGGRGPVAPGAPGAAAGGRGGAPSTTSATYVAVLEVMQP